jgi:hypothetical protein
MRLARPLTDRTARSVARASLTRTLPRRPATGPSSSIARGRGLRHEPCTPWNTSGAVGLDMPGAASRGTIRDHSRLLSMRSLCAHVKGRPAAPPTRLQASIRVHRAKRRRKPPPVRLPTVTALRIGCLTGPTLNCREEDVRFAHTMRRQCVRVRWERARRCVPGCPLKPAMTYVHTACHGCSSDFESSAVTGFMLGEWR